MGRIAFAVGLVHAWRADDDDMARRPEGPGTQMAREPGAAEVLRLVSSLRDVV
jgi:hypothetical protein